MPSQLLLTILTEVRAEISRLNRVAGQTIFDPAVTQLIDEQLNLLNPKSPRTLAPRDESRIARLERLDRGGEAYEEEQMRLQRHFDLVQPKDNWKNPIDCLIRACSDEAMRDINEAVVHFTGSTCKFDLLPKRQMLDGKYVRVIRVTAPGYYATVGA